MGHDILIIDDESDIRELVAGILKDAGYQTRVAADGSQGIAAIRARRPHLIVLDVWLNDPKYDGISLLEIIKRDHADVPIVMISGHGTIETAVAAIKKGAYDFIEKPFKSDRLLLVIQRALEASKLRQENEELRSQQLDNPVLYGQSSSMTQMRQWIQKVASGKTRLLLTGGVGSGKEFVARQIHNLSPRAQGPFVIVNCLATGDLETALFGQETNHSWKEIDVKSGYIEKAHMGTLVLHEVGGVSHNVQSRLLKFLQEGSFSRLGGTDKVGVDVRVIATTSEDLDARIARREFREDLRARLAVMSYQIPKLMQRREDIPALADLFVRRAAQVSQLRPLPIADETIAVLQAYEWPGDISQLRNSVEWAFLNAYCEGSLEITANFLPPEITGDMPSVLSPDQIQGIIQFPLREARELFEKYYLTLQLHRFGMNISQTAQYIKMERSALHRKLKGLGIKCDRDLADTSAA